MPNRRRWLVLVAGLVAVAAGCTVQYGTPFLIPALLADGLTLAQAGLLAACPIAGLLATLLLWGAAADRWGERLVLTVGLGLGGVALLVGASVLAGAGGPPGPPGPPGKAGATGTIVLAVTLLLAGAATAAVHAASGRLVLGWFDAHERGRAMAVRQCAQPLGVAAGALALPTLAGRGLPAALVGLGAGCLVATALVVAVVRNPERPERGHAHRAGSPYREPTLWRIHGASSLLTVPQFVIATYSLVFLVDGLHWPPVPAGRLLAAAQVGGAATRLAAGFWSDRVGRRLGPMRLLAAATGLSLVTLAAASLAGASALAVAALLVSTMLAVSTNGLAFTAVAERAGSAWAGRALGVQNTAQNALAAATPPVFGALIAALSYGGGFAVSVAFPVLAGLLVPARTERIERTERTERAAGLSDRRAASREPC